MATKEIGMKEIGMVTESSGTARRSRGRPPSSGQPANRLHVTFPASLNGRLAELQEGTHAASLTEVFRNALIVYAALWEAHKEGKEIVLRSKEDNRESLLTIFLH
jgi:hypothetical protein